MANHGPSYGLSRELERKNQARFNLEEAQETLIWIEEVTGHHFDQEAHEMQTAGEIGEALKDGVQLCELGNKLLDGQGSLPYKKTPKMPFHKMENISTFLEMIKKYGVPEISCFQTVDLYEGKQLYKVVECLRALAAVAQKKGAQIPYPEWVVKMAEQQPRHFSPDVMKKGDTVISLQYGTNKGASQKGMTPYGLARQILPETP